MSWHFSRVMVAAYSEANCFQAGGSSAQSSWTTTPAESLWPARMTAALNHFRSGMTSLHLTGSRGADWWIEYLAGFRALESPQKETTNASENPKGSQTPKADCGTINSESLAKWNPGRSEWRTIPTLPSEDSKRYSGSFARWGSMRNGVLYRRSKPALPTNENASGLRLPTPTAHNAKEGNYPGERRRKSPPLGALFGGKPNPEYVEWMMGWPIGWTALEALETAKFQQWLNSHGKH